MLRCSACESGEGSDPQRDGKLISYLDFAKVCSRKNIGAFALLFYRKGRYDSRRWVQVPGDERVCVCVCVCFLPIHSGLQWTYQPGSHRKKVTQDFPSTFFLRCLP